MEQKRIIRAAIFDLDGTLIDSMEIWREVDEDFFARRGMPVPEKYQERIAHLGFRECADFTVRNYLPGESQVAVIEEWRELSLSKYSAADGAKYFKAGAIGLLRRLKGAGLRLGVATASSPDFYMPILRAGGVDALFDAFTTVDEAGRNKSFPDIFRISAQKLGVPPAECAVFEDNLTALRAAKSTGMFAVGVYDEASRAAHAAMEREADLFLRSFLDAADFFARV